MQHLEWLSGLMFFGILKKFFKQKIVKWSFSLFLTLILTKTLCYMLLNLTAKCRLPVHLAHQHQNSALFKQSSSFKILHQGY
jgi:hypothetical protein